MSYDQTHDQVDLPPATDAQGSPSNTNVLVAPIIMGPLMRNRPSAPAQHMLPSMHMMPGMPPQHAGSTESMLPAPPGTAPARHASLPPLPVLDLPGPAPASSGSVGTFIKGWGRHLSAPARSGNPAKSKGKVDLPPMNF
eukprot:gene30609-35622_t